MDMNPYWRGDGHDSFFGYHHGGPGALSWTMFALQLLLVIGLVWLIASTLGRGWLRRGTGPGPAPFRGGGFHRPPDPLHILQMRYARGEIGRDEYLQARTDLGGGPEEEQPTVETPPPPPQQ